MHKINKRMLIVIINNYNKFNKKCFNYKSKYKI